ncbi:MAG: hypothetical protein KGZ68_12600 [Dechloromonas sp.]|nr:hypothetical protein [Dechloromonas sp.]
MDCDFWLFLLGFFVCAVGVLFALMFDVGMARLERVWRWLFGSGRDD